MNPDLPAGDPGGSAPVEERTLIKIFGSRTQTDVAVSGLEARGIKCWTTADDAGGMLPNLTAPGGVKLFVRKTDAEAAIALLQAPDAPAEPGSAPSPDTASSRTATKNAFFVFLAGFVAGALVCSVHFLIKADRSGTHTYREDSTGTGHTDMVRVYKDGYLSKVYRDRNLDGKWDYWADYDEHGRPVSIEEDDNFDGKPDAWLTYSNGQLISEQKDTDFNGTPDVTITYKSGIMQQADWTPNGSTNITLRELYTNGVLYETLRDTKGDGHFDQVVQYDAFFNPINTNTFTVVPLP